MSTPGTRTSERYRDHSCGVGHVSVPSIFAGRAHTREDSGTDGTNRTVQLAPKVSPGQGGSAGRCVTP